MIRHTLLLLAFFAALSTLSSGQAPVPFINQPLLPDATAPGGPQFTLTINGTGFAAGSALTVTLTNHASTRTVAINKVLIKGGNFLSFGQTNTCGSSVMAGTSCTFSVTFDPKYKGRRASTLYLWDEGGDTPQTVTLAGDGT